MSQENLLMLNLGSVILTEYYEVVKLMAGDYPPPGSVPRTFKPVNIAIRLLSYNNYVFGQKAI